MPDPHFLVVPLDARPVCYDQVLDLAGIAGLNVSLPPKNLLGHLKEPAPAELLWNWWRDFLKQREAVTAILSLDTLAYGGLIASRVNEESLEVLQERTALFLRELSNTHRPRYGFSSILRIPNYDSDEEEPPYWANYGRMLYQFSVETHQQGSMPRHMFNKIPGMILQDFMARRQKNFYLNKHFIKLVESRTLDFLIFCQDDTGPYGFNVKEAEVLREAIQNNRMQPRALVQTGADEVALILLAKALWNKEGQPLKIYPWFFPEHGRKVVAKFDGVPIGNIVQRQIQTMGGVQAMKLENADLILLVNCPSEQMGDHCIQSQPVREKVHVLNIVESLKTWLPQTSVAIADVVFANGADPQMIDACLQAQIPLDKLVGYAGWNTPGNSIGTALAMGGVVLWAQRHNRLNDLARRKLLLKRFLDDWYYQADVRIRLRRKSPEGLPDESSLKQEMTEGANLLKGIFNLPEAAPNFAFPCQRLFEISIQV